MKKFYVWGTGPVQSALIREAEVSQEAIDAALAHDFVFDSPDGWAVEVEATEEEIDEATRFDSAVAGYAAAELTEVLTDDQFHRAYALAKWHEHEWANIIPQDSPLRNTEEIAAIVNEANKDNYIPYIEAPTLENNVVVHTSGTGRVSWRIHPDGTVNIYISRPAGPALWGNLSPEGVFTCGKEDNGVKFAGRHVGALRRCYRALEPFVRHSMPDFPRPTLNTWSITDERTRFIIDVFSFRCLGDDLLAATKLEMDIVSRILYEKTPAILNSLKLDPDATGIFVLNKHTWHWRTSREGDVCITTY